MDFTPILSDNDSDPFLGKVYDLFGTSVIIHPRRENALSVDFASSMADLEGLRLVQRLDCPYEDYTKVDQIDPPSIDDKAKATFVIDNMARPATEVKKEWPNALIAWYANSPEEKEAIEASCGLENPFIFMHGLNRRKRKQDRRVLKYSLSWSRTALKSLGLPWNRRGGKKQRHRKKCVMDRILGYCYDLRRYFGNSGHAGYLTRDNYKAVLAEAFRREMLENLERGRSHGIDKISGGCPNCRLARLYATVQTKKPEDFMFSPIMDKQGVEHPVLKGALMYCQKGCTFRSGKANQKAVDAFIKAYEAQLIS